MISDKIVVYQSFTDPIHANIVKGLLDSYEIECFLSDENMAALNAMYSAAVGGVKLNVFVKDLDRINAILESENIQTEPILADEKDAVKIACPKCNSANVAFGGSVNKKFGFWNVFVISFITAFLFLMYPFSMRKVYHCFDCQHEFKKIK